MSEQPKTFLFAGGGSGGHLYPGIAVARALKAQMPEAKIKFMATTRPIDKEILSASKDEFIVQPVSPMRKEPWTWLDFFLRFQKSVKICKAQIKENNVVGVLGLGGYASVPAMKAAKQLGVPVVMINPDALPGKANKFAMKYADKICVQWQGAVDYFGKMKDKCIVTGCPVREGIGKGNREVALEALGLDVSKKTLVITGGSLGGHNVNCAVLHCIIDQHGIDSFDQWQVVHITGQLDFPWVKQQYDMVDFKAKVIPFWHNMSEILSVADLMISRAGASILAEISAQGIATLLVPYPYHKDQHQLLNAEMLTQVGGAKVVIDTKDVATTATGLGTELKILMADDALCEKMAKQCLSVGKRDGAAAVAKALVALTK